MVEFRGIVLTETSAKQIKMAPVENIDVNITLDDARVSGKNLLVDFTYDVSYNPNVGKLRFKGTTALFDSSSKLSEYSKHWKKTKMLPSQIMEPLMNLINVTSGVNGVLVCRAINLAPPLIPPKLEVKTTKKSKK